jgi:hypothetical protein
VATKTHAKFGSRWKLIAFAELCCLGCTYDFDQFDSGVSALGGATSAQGSTASAFGGAATHGGSGGTTNTRNATGGRSNAGGQSATSTGGASTSTQPTSCAGVTYGGICWYLGDAGLSCQQECAGHGQVDPGMTSVVGTSAQGGSLAECTTLLKLLGVSGSPQFGTRSDGRGLGCHIYLGRYPWWLNAPNFSVTASLQGTQIVCGCTK